MKTRSVLGYLGSAALLLMGATAHAAIVDITGGTTLTTQNSGSQNNNVLGAGWDLQDNASISSTVANLSVQFFFLGAESGFDNTLVTPFGSHTETSNLFPGSWPGTIKFGGVLVSPSSNGQILSFTSTGFAGSLLPAGGDLLKSIAFAYLSPGCLVSGPPATLVGQSGCVSLSEALDSNGIGYILFALDDSGANADDNHDDYVGVMSYQVVPIPAAAWLLGSGLIGLVGLSRRRKVQA